MQKSLISFISIAVLLLSGLGCQEKEKDQREELLRKSPYKIISDSLRAHPERVDLYLSRALLFSQNNLHELATPDYKKAWELQPDETCGMELSANLMMTNDTLGAISILKTCKNKFPDNENFYKRLSEIYIAIGNPAEALAEYDALLARDSSNFTAYFEKGLVELQRKDTLKALQSLEHSYALQPTIHSALTLANIYSLRLDPRVLTLCDAVLSKDSLTKNTDALFLKGIYFSEKKQFDKAVKMFDACINSDWTFTDAYIEKGLVYYEQKKWEEALKIFEKASNVSSTNADAYYWLGRTYESQGKAREARENYMSALSLEPDFSEASQHLENLGKEKAGAN
jgi:tetratricopeptide (TPR) repeat protein